MKDIQIVTRENKTILIDEHNPDMSVILVCWNNIGYLEPCLDSLYDSGSRRRFEVVVVDNGSTDGSQEMVREKFPQVRIIQNVHNVGLGKASNQGIEATTGRHVLLLNNDTIVNGPSLDSMVEFLDTNPNAGAVGGKLLNPDGSFQAANGRFPSLLQDFFIATELGDLIWPGYPDRGYPNNVEIVDWIGSACLLIRRATLDRIGLLDEEYFIYGDEVDLQYRLKIAGWQVCYLPNVETMHYGGRSMNRWSRRERVYRGKLLFYKKNYGSLRTFTLRVMFGGLSLLKIMIWGIAFALPQWRDRAQKELHSNVEVIQECWDLV